MIRKELTNKKVVRAIALGLSAVMLTTPITAHAEEAPESNTDNEPKNSDNTSTVSEVANEAQDAVVDVKDVSDDAANSVKDVNDAIDAAVDDEVKLDQAVIDAKPGNDPDLSSVDAKMDGVDDKLDTAEQSDAQVTAQKNAADAAQKDAKDAESDAEEIVANAEKAVADATTKIENAATIDDANAAYDEAAQAVTKAQEDFADAKKAYDDAKGAYDAAVKAANDAKAVYDTAVLNAAADADDAKAVYDKALEEANTLHEELLKAQDAVGEVSAEALDIAHWEDVNKTDAGIQWGNEDKLFESIMKGYYLPVVLGIEDENATVKVTKFPGEDSRNYFTVTYTKDGQEVTEYYNYKLEDLELGSSESENPEVLKDGMVIFEKREVEIFGGDADRYVDENGNIVTLEEVANGVNKNGESIIEVDGTYYEKGAMIPSDSDVNITDSKTTVKEGKVTTITTVDVADTTDAEPEYTVDADGNLVKVVRADVTTTIVTYEDKEYTDGVLHDRPEDAEAAGWDYVDGYADEIGEGKLFMDPNVTASEVTVTETQTMYTATGTYIPTFTATLTLDDIEVEQRYIEDEDVADFFGDEGVYYGSEAKREAVKIKAQEYGDYYIFEDQSDYSDLTLDEEDFWDELGDGDPDWLVSGTVTVKYAPVTNYQTTLDDIRGILSSDYPQANQLQVGDNSKLNAYAKGWLEARGCIFISAHWDENGNPVVRYVNTETITATGNSEEEAKNNLGNVAAVEGAEKYNSRVNDEVTSTTTSNDVIKYAYKLTYLERTSETSDTNEEEVLKETYEADELTAQIIQNLNYVNYLAGKEGTISLKQNDGKFRDFVDKNVTLDELNDAYADLLAKVEKAQSDVTTAQNKVKDLQDEIEAMKANGTDISNLLDELESAEIALKDETDRLAALDGELEEAAGVLDEVIDRLTPDPVDNDDEDEDEGGAAPVVPVATPEVLAEAPVAPAAVVTPVVAAGGQGVVEIEDEDTPLAGGIGDGNGNGDTEGEDEVIVAGAEEVEPAIVAIEDEETPLAAGVEADAKMSWWWLLIIALLGATGYKMYKDHQKKKEEAQEA